MMVQNGFLLFEQGAHIFSDEDMQSIEKAMSPDQQDFKRAIISESGITRVSALFYRDKVQTTDYATPLIKKHLGGEKFKNFLKKALRRDVEVVRLQTHIYQEGDFLGKHVDTELGNDIIAAFVFSLTDPNDYEGGDVVFHHPNGAKIALRTPRYSLLITPSWYMHEVMPVTKGSRHIIIGFIKTNTDERFGETTTNSYAA